MITDRPVPTRATPSATRRVVDAVDPAAQSRSTRAVVAAYLALTKPRIVELLLITTVPTMMLAAGGLPDLWLVAVVLLGGASAAGAANALNCYLDRDIDQVMRRTKRRPLPTHTVSPRNALVFGLVLAVVSVLTLAVFTNWLAAGLTLGAIAYYDLVYTLWLKRRTPQNTFWGGVCGAAPVLIGWAAVTGGLAPVAWGLFAVVFFWQLPHFYALAIKYRDDYARAGVPMLPVVAGEAETRWQILVYSALLVALSALLTPIGAMGWIYLVSALLLGAIFMRYAWDVWRKGDQASIWGLYKYSLLYLALLFVAMVVDRAVL